MTIRFTADHYRTKAKQTKTLMDITMQKGEDVRQLVEDCIKVLAEEWRSLCQPLNADRPAKGIHIPAIAEDFYLLEDGTSAIITRGALSQLSTDDVIRKYGGLAFLEKIDVMLDETIALNQQRAAAYQAAIDYAAKRKLPKATG